MWLKAFSGSLADPSDATLSQTVATTVGGDYTFSRAGRNGKPIILAAWRRSPVHRRRLQTLLEMAFLDASNVVIGTPVTLNLKAAGQVE